MAPTDSPTHSGRNTLWATDARLRWLLMTAVFIIYAVLALARHSETLIWDEGRYLAYARHLTQGFYVTEANPDFVNGPGYPIVLMPFSAMGTAGWLGARLLNAFFMAAAVGFIWATVRHYAGRRWATASALFVGLHPTLVWMGFAVMTEPLTTFCISGFLWSYCTALRAASGRLSRRWIITAIFFLGWLTLTRVFFGHVIMATAFLCLLLLPLPFLRDWRPALKRTLLILAGAFLLCIPYLVHTWQKTGQVLCWSTNSGELLYWITSTNSGENGHWFSTQDTHAVPEVADHHAIFYREALSLPVLEREALFKTVAKQQLKENPIGVAYNWVCNLVRLAFGFPRSHQEEELRTLVLIATNGPLLLLALLAGLIALRYWRSLPPEIWLLQAVTAFYLGGTSLAPSLPRYFVVIVPFLLLGIATVLHSRVRLHLLTPDVIQEPVLSPP